MFKRQAVIVLLCLFLIVVTIGPVVASAAGYDYTDYITDIRVDGDNDIVTANMPIDSCRIGFYSEPSYTLLGAYGNPATLLVDNSNLGNDTSYNIEIGPFGKERLDISNIPSGSILSFTLDMNTSGGGYNTPLMSIHFTYYDSNGNMILRASKDYGTNVIYDLTFSAELQKPVGATELAVSVAFYHLTMLDTTPGKTITVKLSQIVLEMQISSLYRLQQETGKTNEILDEVENQLKENGQTLEEVLEQQGQTNEKLDELPGEIGDEMQDIIDGEKQEAEESGNDFVGQILDILPDPSVDVLASLKNLTDATAYTGTEAVLPIPAIVLPGIEGLFPETEIYGGTDFDFGYYLGILPPALLVLVRNLFTIAIVLFCVYELKGIISYCLTLRENKGG